MVLWYVGEKRPVSRRRQQQEWIDSVMSRPDRQPGVHYTGDPTPGDLEDAALRRLPTDVRNELVALIAVLIYVMLNVVWTSLALLYYVQLADTDGLRLEADNLTAQYARPHDNDSRCDWAPSSTYDAAACDSPGNRTRHRRDGNASCHERQTLACFGAPCGVFAAGQVVALVALSAILGLRAPPAETSKASAQTPPLPDDDATSPATKRRAKGLRSGGAARGRLLLVGLVLMATQRAEGIVCIEKSTGHTCSGDICKYTKMGDMVSYGCARRDDSSCTLAFARRRYHAEVCVAVADATVCCCDNAESCPIKEMIGPTTSAPPRTQQANEQQQLIGIVLLGTVMVMFIVACCYANCKPSGGGGGGVDVERAIVDEQPAVVDEQAAFVDEQPAVVDEQAAFVDEQPAVVDEQPAVVDEQAAFVDEQPAFVDEQPAFVDKQPAFVDKQPAFVDKQPAFVDKQPAFVDKQAAFVDKQPAFVDKQPAFVDKQPAFVDEQPAFVDKQPAFVDKQPAFVDKQPAFVDEQPAFVDEQPAFVDKQPAFVDKQPAFVDKQPAFVDDGLRQRKRADYGRRKVDDTRCGDVNAADDD